MRGKINRNSQGIIASQAIQIMNSGAIIGLQTQLIISLSEHRDNIKKR